MPFPHSNFDTWKNLMQGQTIQLVEGIWNLPRFLLWAVSEETLQPCIPSKDLYHGFQKKVLRENERTQELGIDFQTLQRKGQTLSLPLSTMWVGWGWRSWYKTKELCPSPRWPHHGRNVTSCPCHHTSPSTITHHLYTDSPGGDHQLPLQFSRYTS